MPVLLLSVAGIPNYYAAHRAALNSIVQTERGGRSTDYVALSILQQETVALRAPGQWVSWAQLGNMTMNGGTRGLAASEANVYLLEGKRSIAFA